MWPDREMQEIENYFIQVLDKIGLDSELRRKWLVYEHEVISLRDNAVEYGDTYLCEVYVSREKDHVRE